MPIITIWNTDYTDPSERRIRRTTPNPPILSDKEILSLFHDLARESGCMVFQAYPCKDRNHGRGPTRDFMQDDCYGIFGYATPELLEVELREAEEAAKVDAEEKKQARIRAIYERLKDAEEQKQAAEDRKEQQKKLAADERHRENLKKRAIEIYEKESK